MIVPVLCFIISHVLIGCLKTYRETEYSVYEWVHLYYTQSMITYNVRLYVVCEKYNN